MESWRNVPFCAMISHWGAGWGRGPGKRGMWRGDEARKMGTGGDGGQAAEQRPEWGAARGPPCKTKDGAKAGGWGLPAGGGGMRRADESTKRRRWGRASARPGAQRVVVAFLANPFGTARTEPGPAGGLGGACRGLAARQDAAPPEGGAAGVGEAAGGREFPAGGGERDATSRRTDEDGDGTTGRARRGCAGDAGDGGCPATDFPVGKICLRGAGAAGRVGT